ncbi:hypothetical protein ACJRO7_034218 [Eucalyptus globulus]|uniref:Uncharacterized protein n=1 Tax=Eucalyptus globulus TaxID=34317 RepID=A0ABD3J5W4_EUCGL
MTQYLVTRWYHASELLFSCDDNGTHGLHLCRDPRAQAPVPRERVPQPAEADHQYDREPEGGGHRVHGYPKYPKAQRYIKALPFLRGTHFSRLYLQADLLAVHLLQRMPLFEPRKRMMATEAPQRPYMVGLWNEILHIHPYQHPSLRA